MKKNRILQLAIVIAVLAVVLPLVFTARSSYTDYVHIDWNNHSKALTFDLKTGQTVNGYFSLNNSERTGYIIYNDEVGEIIVSKTSENRGEFVFKAKADGQYYLSIYYDSPFGTSIGYSYTISSAFIGIDLVVWIVLVIVIGIIAELFVTLKSIRKKRKAD